jgi:hypothetical protein
VKSGFVGFNVGFLVGFSGLPDNDSLFGIIGLGSICRVCRVSTRVETSVEIAKNHISLKIFANPLLELDLNDAAS